MMVSVVLKKLLLAIVSGQVAAYVTIPAGPLGSSAPLPALPADGPDPVPSYMVDNINNNHGKAPDHGVLDGPVLHPIDKKLYENLHGNTDNFSSAAGPRPKSQGEAAGGGYWLASLGSKGKMPLAPSGYQFFRNVQDFGAVGDGTTDDTAAINRAIAYQSKTNSKLRCGKDCGSTTTQGALVYFPPGTYQVSTPLIIYYHTQIVGDPTDRPTIKGSTNFTGMALIDSDPYIPFGNGAEWYINQSNFYRQVRNLIIDLRGMKATNTQGPQRYHPTGIHWQVGQATSITNCDFLMDESTGSQKATSIGIFMENGSGGFMSDLFFKGGNIGFRAGSQQFTVTNLRFQSCVTAVSMIWDWGLTWKNLYIESCHTGLDLTEYSGLNGQGVGSVSIIDSHFNGVENAITVRGKDPEPNVILDNLLVENCKSVISVLGGDAILAGSTSSLYFKSWGMGPMYLNADSVGASRTGFIRPEPEKPNGLLEAATGRYFVRTKPQYADASPVVATDHGVSNNNEGDQTNAINSLLSSNIGSLIYFPAGIYLCKGTINVPPGSKIIGSGWSQIVAVGAYFEKEDDPKVLVQVGKNGDSGIVEITDMLFTVRGATAGCILMEWNIHESSQGSAAMWDSHFRVGGAEGSFLQLADCPAKASSAKPSCMAAAAMLHVTKSGSGYFENVWAWVADHDLDNPGNKDAYEDPTGIPLSVSTQISVYVARGILIESNGPTWFYGTSSEHSQLYQYQCANASNVFFGHMQTESPYYQPNPVALEPYKPSGDNGRWNSDPTFDDCADDDCKVAWALRLIGSEKIFIYSAGFYSFFQDNTLGCTGEENCQLRMIDTNYVTELYIYNIFTKGNVEIISPQGGPQPITFNDTTRNGYTSEIAAWLVLAKDSKGIGHNNKDGSGDVYIGTEVWDVPHPTVQCQPPCVIILPPFPLGHNTTIKFPPKPTKLEVGWTTTTTYTNDGKATTEPAYTSVTQLTVLYPPPWVGGSIDVSNVPINGSSTRTIYPRTSILPTPYPVVDDPNPENKPGVSHAPNTRTITPRPYPDGTDTPTTTTTTTGLFPPVVWIPGPPKPTCRAGCGHRCRIFCGFPCIFNCGHPEDDFHDSNDPNKGSDDEECTTKTYSDCRTYCVTQNVKSCTSTCSDVVGCSTTGTDIASTVTPAPLNIWQGEQWPEITDDPEGDLNAAIGVLSYLSALGDMKGISDPLPPSTTTSKPTSPPTDVPPPDPSQICFGEVTGPVGTGQVLYNYAVWPLGAYCESGVYVADGNIGSSIDVCQVNKNHTKFNFCKETLYLQDSGPKFFGNKCGVALDLGGHIYETGHELKNDSRCDDACPGNSYAQGLLVFTDITGCAQAAAMLLNETNTSTSLL